MARKEWIRAGSPPNRLYQKRKPAVGAEVGVLGDRVADSEPLAHHESQSVA
jgi:hypothetical protein